MKFPVYNSQQTPNVGSTPRINSSAFAAPGRAIAQVGNQLSAVAQHAQNRADQRSMFQFQTGLNDAKAQAHLDFNANLSNSPTAHGVAQQTMSQFEAKGQQLLSNVPEHLKERAQELLSRRAAGLRVPLTNQELGARYKHYQGSLNKAITNSENLVSTDPNSFSEQWEDIEELIENTELPGHTKQQLRTNYRQRLEYAHAMGRINQGDYEGVMEDLQRVPKSNLNLKGAKINLKGTDTNNLAKVAKTAAAAGFDPVLAAAIGHFESAGTLSTTMRPVSSRGTMVRGGKKVLSSALGIFQFLDSNQKEFGYGSTAEEQTKAFVRKNNKETSHVSRVVGRKLQPWEKYLTHFQGPGGAAGFLKANPNDTVYNVLKRIGGGNYASQVISSNPWMSKTTTVSSFLGRVKNEIETRMSALEGVIPSAKAGSKSNQPQQQEEQQGFVYESLDVKQRQRLGILIQKAQIKSQNASYVRNLISEKINASPYDKEAKSKVNKAFESAHGPDVDFLANEGAQKQALELVGSTGIIPDRVKNRLRFGLDSSDPKTLLQSYQLMDRLEQSHEQGFKAAMTETQEGELYNYRKLAEMMGPEKAIERILTTRSPEYRDKIKAPVFAKEVREFEKGLNPEQEIQDNFRDWGTFLIPWSNVAVGFSSNHKNEILNTYNFHASEHFKVHGDAEQARAYAAGILKSRFGMTNITGSQTFMKYPPEKFYNQENIQRLQGMLSQGLKDVTSGLKKQRLKVIGEPFIMSDQETYKSVQQWQNNETETEEIVTQSEAGIAVVNNVPVRKHPSWQVMVKVKHRDTDLEYFMPIGRLSGSGLSQLEYEADQKKKAEIRKRLINGAKIQEEMDNNPLYPFVIIPQQDTRIF